MIWDRRIKMITPPSHMASHMTAHMASHVTLQSSYKDIVANADSKLGDVCLVSADRKYFLAHRIVLVCFFLKGLRKGRGSMILWRQFWRCSNKMCDDGGGGVKNCTKLGDIIYGRRLRTNIISLSIKNVKICVNLKARDNKLISLDV